MNLTFPYSFNDSMDYSALSESQRILLAESGSASEAECFLNMWLHFPDTNITTEIYCSATWDNYYCWPPTPSDTVIKRYCSDVIPKEELQYSFSLEGNVTRTCLKNGTWAQGIKSNYKECANSFRSKMRREKEDEAVFTLVQYMLFIGSLVSLLCLGISLGIFYYYRLLRCDRVTVQVHLMVSLLLRFVLMFTIAEPHVLGHTKSFRDVDILCELILVGFLYLTLSSVSWMFVQGLFLNITLISGALDCIAGYHLLLYYTIGWGVPGIFVLLYSVAMLLRKQERCWNGYSEMNEIWIILCPIILEVAMNGVFLANILRILLIKVRNSHTRPDASQIVAAAKATAFLFPVLGINNLFLLYNPGGDYDKYFVTLNTFFGSTQGFFVALVYCFLNKEVWAAVRRSVDRSQARRSVSGIHGSEHHSRVRVSHYSHHTMVELATFVPQPSEGSHCMEQEAV